jgi:PII-like signaling protein
VVPAKRIRVYVSEVQRQRGRPLYQAIVEAARAHGLSGATVTRAMEGWSADGRWRTATVVDLAADLPVVVEIVDEPAKVAAFLPELRILVRRGLVTVEDVEALFIRGGGEAG